MLIHTSYVICATPRTGSYLLCEALRNTGLAGQPDEYFFRGDDLGWREGRNVALLADYVAQDLEKGTTPNGVFGTKVMRGYFDNFVDKLRLVYGEQDLPVPDLLAKIFPNLHYIFITRRNKVRQAVSLEKALQTKAWILHPQVASPVIHENELVFDLQRIDYLIHQTERQEAEWQDYFWACNVQPLTVVYEDLVLTYEETALRALEYLDIPIPEHMALGKRYLQRQADGLSEEWVRRYLQEKGVQGKKNDT
jgi:trehalose 2-sulfotransferase